MILEKSLNILEKSKSAIHLLEMDYYIINKHTTQHFFLLTISGKKGIEIYIAYIKRTRQYN